MCNFGPVGTPWGPPGVLCQKKNLSICLRGLIIVLFCRIHCLDVPMRVWSSQDALGPQKGDKVFNPLPPNFPLFATEKKFLKANALEWFKNNQFPISYAIKPSGWLQVKGLLMESWNCMILPFIVLLALLAGSSLFFSDYQIAWAANTNFSFALLFYSVDFSFRFASRRDRLDCCLALVIVG